MLATVECVPCAAAAGHTQGQPVAVSQDAGLFVCNWTYYKSLQQSQQQDSKQKWHSVFVHVPPLEMAGPEQQLRMAAAILDSMAASVTPVQGQPVQLVLGQGVESAGSCVARQKPGRSMLSCFSWCHS